MKDNLGTADLRAQIVIIGFAERDDRKVVNGIEKRAAPAGRDVIGPDIGGQKGGFPRRPASLVAVFVSCQDDLYSVSLEYRYHILSDQCRMVIIHIWPRRKRRIVKINYAPKLSGRPKIVL